MAEQNIGAARVHLVVDATDWDSTLAQARNAAAQFGTDAERAFDRSTGGVRRASTRLLDYVAALGRVDTQMERYIRNASRAGVEEPIIRAAIARWSEYQKEIMSTTAALEEAARIDKAFNQARAESAQRDITAQVAPGLDRDTGDQARRRADAEAALLPVLQQQEAAYDQMVRSQYEQLNAMLGVADAGRDTGDQARRRADAEAALLPLLQDQERQYSDMLTLAHRINDARDEARRGAAQQDINSTLGVDDTSAEQRIRRQADARAALTDIVEKEIAAEQKLQAARQQGEQFITYLKNLGDTAGKTHYEILELKAAQLGISAEAAPMIKGLKDQAAAMGAGTLTTKQYEWAMRGLPAQLTDISVGLATGQKPWMVMLQQGGQLKDMFGGIAPAAKALGGALWAMVTPLSVAAVALAGIAAAAYGAAKSMEELAIATAKGDGFAGATTDLYELADALNGLDNISLGNAEDAVARLASGGKLTGDNFKLAAEAAARWATTTGESADSVAGKFEAIAKGPLEAIESGQIRVTEAQYEHIKALVQAGGQQEAVNELTRIYYDTVNRNSAQVEAHLAGTTRMFRGMKDELGELVRGIGNFANGIADAYVNATMLGRQSRDMGEGFFASRMKALTGLFSPEAQAPAAAAAASNEPNYDPEQAKRDKQRTDELARWNATADKAAARELTINGLREEGIKLGQDQAAIEAIIARQRKQWAEQDAKAAAGRGGEGRDGTQAIRDAAQAEIAAITTQTRLLQQQYDQRAITVEDYYTKLQSYADEELAVNLRSIEAQKAAVAGRKDAAQRLDQLESQAARAREQYAQRDIELDEQRRRAVQQREIAFRDYVRSLDAANDAAQRDADLAVARISMGAKEYERMVALNDALRRRTELEEELDRRVADGSLNPDDAMRYRDALELVNDQIRIMTEGWDRVDEAQANALNGMSAAWEDWLAETQDVAKQWGDIFTNAMSGLSDGIANMLAGNEQDWEGYFQNLHTMILRFIVQQQLTKFMQSFMGGGAGGQGSLFDLFSGGSGFGFAQGGTPGGSGLSAYRNSIVSQPTVFPFARGGVPNVGLMGERSGKPHEAIMPLTRTTGGDLGVRVVESKQSAPVNVNQTFVVQGKPDRQTREQMARQAGRETSRALRRN